MKKIFLLATSFLAALSAIGKPQTLFSPDGRLKVIVETEGSIRYDVYAGDVPVMTGNTISMTLPDRVLGQNPRLQKAARSKADELLHPFLALKASTVRNRYNALTLTFKGGYAVEFRAFDDGMAYRFITSLKGEIDVVDEQIGVHFPTEGTLTLQQCGGFKTSYEERYSLHKTTEWVPGDQMAHLPILAGFGGGLNVFFSETALTDYPGAFFKGTGEGGFRSVFPKAPLAFGEDGDRSLKITEEAPYIARTAGTRAFPWRYFVITRKDGDLVETTLPVCLAERCALSDVSWIKPGQASWEWWNGATPFGPDVNFVAGCNLETYKYFIDFAAHYGIPYIVMDEGWARTTLDPFTPNPDVDLHELIRYGREKGVGIILWLTWLCVENHPEVFATFEDWGIAGIKVDFMDRSDQWMVNYYERTVAEAAKHHLFIDFHGAYKPSGLEYKYPNLLSYEGVRGMEQMGGCTPENSLWHPFVRNVTGAMEYTPGAMNSMQPELYFSKRPNSASIGTRAYQLALFVVFESGIQMLADNPTLYYRNDECTRFITEVPVLWDETVALSAKAGDHVAVAKRSGQKWYIGAITAEHKEPLCLQIPLDFLEAGHTYKVTLFRDGPNAARQALDYRKETLTVRKGDILDISMVRNGGYAAVIE